MSKADFADWLAQNRTRLTELLCQETEAGARAKGQVLVDLEPRVRQWVERFVAYLKSGDMQIIITQIEQTNRNKLLRGEPLDFKSAEEQAVYILRASASLLKASEFSPQDQAHFLQQIERSIHNFTIAAKTIYSRLVLEQANLAKPD